MLFLVMDILLNKNEKGLNSYDSSSVFSLTINMSMTAYII